MHEAIVEEASKELARRDFEYYLGYVDPKYQLSKLVLYLASILTQVEHKELADLICTCGPRFGKSRLLAHFAAWWIGRHPGESLLYLSASAALSIRNSRWVRDDILSERYPWPVEISQESSSVVAWRTTTGCEVRALSVESTIMGMQANLAISDDIQAEMGSAVTRENLHTWLKQVLETRREPGAPSIILQNRYSTDDIVAKLLDAEDGDSWKLINIESICETPELDPLGRKEGESAWAERWPVHLLQKKKLRVGSYIWNSSYQGKPVPEGGRLININLFKEFESLPVVQPPAWNPLDLYYTSPLAAAAPDTSCFIRVTGIDCAGVTTSTTTGSFSAWVSGLLDTRTSNIYITKVGRARNVTFDELKMQVLTFLNSQEPQDAIICESEAQGARLGEALKGLVRSPIIFVSPKGKSKSERCLNILPIQEAGMVYLPKAAPWKADFLNELQDFPGGRNDDMVDAWVYAVTFLKQQLQRRQADNFFDSQLAALADGFMGR